jgi:hypothetical protein
MQKKADPKVAPLHSRSNKELLKQSTIDPDAHWHMIIKTWAYDSNRGHKKRILYLHPCNLQGRRQKELVKYTDCCIPDKTQASLLSPSCTLQEMMFAARYLCSVVATVETHHPSSANNLTNSNCQVHHHKWPHKRRNDKDKIWKHNWVYWTYQPIKTAKLDEKMVSIQKLHLQILHNNTWITVMNLSRWHQLSNKSFPTGKKDQL